MLKKTVWYMCLGLLCLMTLTFMVFADSNPNARQGSLRGMIGPAPVRKAIPQVQDVNLAKLQTMMSDPNYLLVKQLNARYRTGENLTSDEMGLLRQYVPNPSRISHGERPLDQGGEDCGAATVIPSLPYSDTGTTVGYLDNYDETCPLYAPGSPDVAYSFTPETDVHVNVSLCGNSAYDTKMYIYQGTCPGTLVACNDDYCTTPSFPYAAWVSFLDCVPLPAGTTYYIIVDGFGGDAGNYTLDVAICDTTTGRCCYGSPVPTCANNRLYQCNALGGIWEDALDCTTPCPMPLGRCCFGDPANPSCTDNLTGPDCGALGGTWTQGLSCAENPCPIPPGCLPGSVISRPPDILNPDPGFWPSEEAYPSFVSDDYAVPGPVYEIRFWGLNLDWNIYPCSEDPMLFNIQFHQDSLGYPGAVVASFGPSVSREETGFQVFGFPLYQYSYALPNPVTLLSGWISIQGAGDPNCLFLWAVTNGAGVARWWCCGGYWDLIGRNMSLCIVAACDEAEDLTIMRGAGLQDNAELHWNATQTYGFYKVYGTSVKNHDGSPDHGDDPNWTLLATLPAPVAPGIMTFVDSPLQFYMNYVIEHDCTPALGRCCYGPIPSCVHNTQSECNTLGGVWDDSLDCSTPCPTPIGRCCYGANCAVNTEAECALLIGTWTYGSDCGTPCPPPVYCAAQGGECYEHISRVQFVTIDNSSPCSNYADYTSISTTVSEGAANTITVINAPDGVYWGGDEVDVWVDWNNDYLFTGENEYFPTTLYDFYTFVGTVTAPAGSEGTHRMRIRLRNGGVVDPCGMAESYTGEVEDYTIIVATPIGRCCYGSPFPECADNTLNECNALGGIWDAASNCGNPCPLPIGRCCYGDPLNPSCADNNWIDCYFLAGTWDDALSCAINPCPIATTGRCCYGANCAVNAQATCLALGGEWTEGLDCSIPCPTGRCCYGTNCVVNYPSECAALYGVWTEGIDCSTPCPPPEYCAAQGGICDEHIGQVLLNTINNSSGCTSSYDDYTSISTTLVAGSSTPITVINGGPSYEGDAVDVWVDWNNDFLFTGGNEWFESTTSDYHTFTGAVTAPAGSQGTHRMRIRLRYFGIVSPCGQAESIYGEVEDYTVSVIAVPVGRCCYGSPIQSCADNTLDQCNALGGAWDDVLDCTNNPCPPPTGRCCYGSPIQSCADNTLDQCNALGGTWDDVLDCTNNPCPPIGRCCYGDPYNPSCEDTTLERCNSLGGYWNDTLSCANDPCLNSIGRCCYGDLMNPSCQDADFFTCEGLFNGIWNGGLSCTNNPCPTYPPGRCCYGDPNNPYCYDTDSVTCVTDYSGTWNGAVTCASDPCPQPLGRCCYGTDCAVHTLSECNALGGTWTVGIDCSIPCPTGRCCYGTYCAVNYANQCNALYGVWTEGIDCLTPCPPPVFCAATGGSSWVNAIIVNVTFVTINNSSGSNNAQNNYTDYTNLSAIVLEGVGNTITVTNMGSYYTVAVDVWVDWNNNFLFTDPGEYTSLATTDYHTFTATITAPVGSQGTHRMRIRLRESGVVNPCGQAGTDWGEVEDYTVIVQ